MINFRLMKQLWMFSVVAEEQHFGRAAKRLGMSQPPLTEQIKVLEQALKVTLFERSRQGTRLTPIGAAILPAVQRLVQQMGQVERAVDEAVRGRTGVLTIGAVSSAMFDVLPPIVEALKKKTPGLAISVHEIDSVEAVPALEAGEIDLAFARLEGPPNDRIGRIALQESALCVALHRHHPLAARTRIPLSALNDEEFVMFERRYSPLYFDHLMATCGIHGFSPRTLHEVRSITAQIAFVGCGQGVALVPASMRKMAPQSVLLKPLKEKIMVTTATVAWNRTRVNPLVTAALTVIGTPTPA
ncbi:LysR substrate-binding domain-containing protein [Herbaspirillum sp. alder98]|uniref:LysR substrate-binding domain-containing protein n=1 Tax=Herbaspirillum sp. alder98 TaxID=2913096 RepID=UPI001CD8C656|nr:LysR substrate-binding domain-containing protein [Herbaspirillum sp. alder98]MCA1325065.1 LysR family transcriptional regulator [Herbaspirillum sp. alder98]